MRKQIAQYCHECVQCNQKKGPVHKNRAPMNPIPVHGAFHRVGMDVLQLTPTLSGNRVVIVITNYLTKWTEGFASPDAKATNIARFFMENIVARFGCPLEIVTDRGKNFQSKLLQEICNLCAIRKISTSSYHPETNGLVERFNRTLCNMLSMYVTKQQNDWDLWLPYCLFAYNTAKQDSTQESPYFLLYGRDPRLPVDVTFNALRARTIPWTSDYAKSIALRLTQAHELALH
ncbi:MAG: transposase family protein, partial [bacterium]|nr:transposase family protein [bacterium]